MVGNNVIKFLQNQHKFIILIRNGKINMEIGPIVARYFQFLPVFSNSDPHFIKSVIYCRKKLLILRYDT